MTNSFHNPVSRKNFDKNNMTVLLQQGDDTGIHSEQRQLHDQMIDQDNGYVKTYVEKRVIWG